MALYGASENHETFQRLSKMDVMRKALKIALMCSLSYSAIAATPAKHSDDPDHAWYEQQYNLRNGHCCGLGDAYILEEDEWKNIGDDLYQVKIDGQWHNVERFQRRDLSPSPAYAHTPLRGTPSPSKKAVVWYSRVDGGLNLYCFSPWENLY